MPGEPLNRSALLSVLLLAPGAFVVGCAHPRPVRVVSLNIRYGTAPDGENRWENRRRLLLDTLRDLDPDILGLQEVLAFQADELQAALPGYGFTGVGRDDGRRAGEFVPIMFRRARFELQQAGHVWLSPTPDIPGSRGWDAALTRMATWVVLRTRDSRPLDILVVNTHFDHQGAQARLESARMLGHLLAQHPGRLAVLTGDLNCGPDSPPYRALTADTADPPLRDPWALLSSDSADLGTYHAFTGIPQGPRIDFILCGRGWQPLAADIDRRHDESVYPSDHFPVTALLLAE